jgi:predicted component of type VI protein secretion system
VVEEKEHGSCRIQNPFRKLGQAAQGNQQAKSSQGIRDKMIDEAIESFEPRNRTKDSNKRFSAGNKAVRIRIRIFGSIPLRRSLEVVNASAAADFGSAEA